MSISRPVFPWIFALFLLLAYFPLFLHLDSLSLRLWDESRRAVNALEMLDSGNLLVPHFDGEPDMWGTKPPLLVWLQAGAMAVFGYNELAVRLPSALAGLATALLLVWFGYRQMARPALGFLAALVLLTTPGYLEEAHSARTGDYDALLTLWLTGSLLFFFSYHQATEDRISTRYLWLTAACLALGVLTKAVAGLFMTPGLLLFAIATGAWRDLLRRRQTYLALGAFLLAVLGYYLFREAVNPGFLRAVWDNELGGRYIEGREGYHYGFGYYFYNLWAERMPYWIYFVPIGAVLGWRTGGRWRDLVLLAGGGGLLLLLVISDSKTKMGWYDLPAYPSLALLAAIPLALILESDGRRLGNPAGWKKYAFSGFFLFVFYAYPYSRAIDLVYLPADRRHHQWEKMQYGYFIKGNPDLLGYQIGVDEYNAHVNFYVKAFNKKGYNLRINRLKEPLALGERILVCDPVFKDRLRELQEGKLEPVRDWGTCVLFEVKE